MLHVHCRLGIAAVFLALLACTVSGFNFTDDATSADGCRYVFLDVGSNLGMHVRFLYEAEKYPQNKYSKAIFDKYFPIHRNRSDVCAFGFEPNPAHAVRLDRLTTYFQKQSLHAAFFHGAVSNVTSSAKFYARASDLNSAVEFTGQPRKNFTAEFTVNTIDLSGFILDKIAKRKIPSELFPDDPPARVLMKMDIEGFEYVVLPMMLATKALCELDVLTLELHHTANIRKGSDMIMRDKLKDARKRGCKVKVVSFDDESYKLDSEQGLAELL